MGIRQSESLVKSDFHTNEDGWPTGGRTIMLSPAYNDQCLRIEWQDGIIGDDGQNGAFVEDVIEAARQRIKYFNDNPKTRCRENSLAITKLEEALQWLDWRTRQRVAQGVENTYAGHSDGGAPGG